jgi:ribosomal protein S18 acetylase RimI-like enzyme
MTMTDITVKLGTDHVDWPAVCELIRRAPLGTRDPEKLKTAAENSYAVCTAYAGRELIGFGRALSDGVYQSSIYDVVVLPALQGQGVGQAIMDALITALPPDTLILVHVAPGKQEFYRKFGFGDLKTGMGRFPDPVKARSNGYLV